MYNKSKIKTKKYFSKITIECVKKLSVKTKTNTYKNN